MKYTVVLKQPIGLNIYTIGLNKYTYKNKYITNTRNIKIPRGIYDGLASPPPLVLFASTFVPSPCPAAP